MSAALCSATKTTGNITKTTDDDRGGKENKEISQKETCFLHGVNYEACVEQLHLFTYLFKSRCLSVLE